jgi:hypothetical protein
MLRNPEYPNFFFLLGCLDIFLSGLGYFVFIGDMMHACMTECHTYTVLYAWLYYTIPVR